MAHYRSLLGAVGAAFLCNGAFAQSWDDKVTMTVGARPVGEVVAELAKKSGLQMTVEGTAKSDIVFLSVKDMTVRVVAEKIAAATGSHWNDQGGIYRLQRTAAEERKQWADDAQLRKPDIEKAIATMVQAVETTRQQQNGRSTQMAGPGQKATAAILQLLPVDALAMMEPDQRLVFATKSTSMQKTLSGSALSTAKKFFAEEVAAAQQQYAAMQANSQNQGRPNRGLQAMERNLQMLRNAKVDRVLMILQNQGSMNCLVQLQVLDSQGMALMSGMLNLQYEAMRRGGNEQGGAAGGGPDALKFSDEATAMAALWRRTMRGDLEGQFFSAIPALGAMFGEEGSNIALQVSGMTIGGEEPEAIAEAIRTLASQPDQYEPLDYFVPELLRLAAESEGAGIVACIPDAAMQPAANLVLAGAGAKQIWSSIKDLQMTAELQDGVYVVSPRLQSRSRYERMNREAAAALVTAAKKKGYASLEDLGRYALASTRGAFTGPLDLRLISIAHPEAGNALRRNSGNQEALAIFTGLGEQRRRDMVTNNLTYPITSTNAKDETTWLTYNSLDGPQWRDPNARNDRNRRGAGDNQVQLFQSVEMVIADGQVLQRGGNPQMRPAQERTDFLPSGVPSTTKVSMTSNANSMLRASENQDQTARTAMLTPEQIGAQRAQRDSPAFAEARASMPEYRSFTMAEQETYIITISYPDGFAMTRMLQEVRISPDSRPMSLGDLPEDVRRRIDAAYQQTYDAMKNVRVGRANGGNGNRTPPP